MSKKQSSAASATPATPAPTTVGSYEAKTHLPQLLRRVAGGEKITITKHGVPVAELVPPGTTPQRLEIRETIAKIREFRKGKSLGDISIKDAIAEGRR